MIISTSSLNNAVKMTFASEDEWLAERQKSIGASETPELIGLGFADGGPARVWESKVRPGYRTSQEVELLQIGQVMEPAIRAACRVIRGMRVIDPSGRDLWRHPDYPHMHATLDGDVLEGDELGIIEIKNVSGWNGDDWEDATTAPLRVQVQVQHQLACTGRKFGYAAGLIGGNQLRVVRIERNDEFIAAIAKHVVEFWQFIEREEMPPIDGLKATTQVLRRLHPDDSGETIELSDELVAVVDRLAEIKAGISDAEKEKTALENQLLVAIGDATYGQLADGRAVSWKTQTRSGYTVAPTKFRVLRTHANHPERKRKSR